MKRRAILTSVLLGACLLAAGCGSGSNPLAPFSPEIISNADSFQFQITDGKNVTVTETYTWTNPTNGVSVDHSTAKTDGGASMVIRDASGVQVYSSELKASGSEQSISGNPGDWTVQVIFSNFDGTANFRVEKLPL
ncbi:hypothetical protein GW813_03225 [bacterium]|nr:hypothetical protein [bacterium]